MKRYITSRIRENMESIPFFRIYFRSPTGKVKMVPITIRIIKRKFINILYCN